MLMMMIMMMMYDYDDVDDDCFASFIRFFYVCKITI